jgi:hypothetical protein
VSRGVDLVDLGGSTWPTTPGARTAQHDDATKRATYRG